MPADVTRPDDADRICAAVEEAFGPIQALVNSAGSYGEFVRFTDTDGPGAAVGSGREGPGLAGLTLRPTGPEDPLTA